MTPRYARVVLLSHAASNSACSTVAGADHSSTGFDAALLLQARVSFCALVLRASVAVTSWCQLRVLFVGAATVAMVVCAGCRSGGGSSQLAGGLLAGCSRGAMVAAEQARWVSHGGRQQVQAPAMHDRAAGQLDELP